MFEKISTDPADYYVGLEWVKENMSQCKRATMDFLSFKIRDRLPKLIMFAGYHLEACKIMVEKHGMTHLDNKLIADRTIFDGALTHILSLVEDFNDQKCDNWKGVARNKPSRLKAYMLEDLGEVTIYIAEEDSDFTIVMIDIKNRLLNET